MTDEELAAFGIVIDRTREAVSERVLQALCGAALEQGRLQQRIKDLEDIYISVDAVLGGAEAKGLLRDLWAHLKIPPRDGWMLEVGPSAYGWPMVPGGVPIASVDVRRKIVRIDLQGAQPLERALYTDPNGVVHDMGPVYPPHIVVRPPRETDGTPLADFERDRGYLVGEFPLPMPPIQMACILCGETSGSFPAYRPSDGGPICYRCSRPRPRPDMIRAEDDD